MRIKQIVILILTLAITGCGLYGPTYSKPEISTPKKFHSRDYLSEDSNANLPLTAWWKNFNDPQLNYLIESALKNNNNIQVAIGNIEAAKGQLQQVQYMWIPTMNLGASYTNAPAYLTPIGYVAGLLPTYALNIFQLIRSIEYAKANLEAVRAAKDVVRLSVITQTVGGYFTLLGQDYLLRLQQQLVADLHELLRLAKLQYQKGLISLYSLQQYEQQYEKAKSQIPILQNNIVSAQNTLRLLLNQNPGDIKRGIAFMNLKSNGIIPASLPSRVLRNRPDVQQAEQQLIAANANIGVAIATFFPTIALTNNVGSAAPQLNGLFSSSTDFWNKQILATMPILSFGTYGQIKQAKGLYYAAYYNYVQTVRNAFAAVDTDLSAHEQYYKSLMSQIKFYDSSKVAYKLATKSYHKGLYSLPTLLNNKVTMDNALISVANSKITQLNTIIQLYQDLAGGYMLDDTEKLQDNIIP
jgi:outer membrane protein, multidrug efflux system